MFTSSKMSKSSLGDHTFVRLLVKETLDYSHHILLIKVKVNTTYLLGADSSKVIDLISNRLFQVHFVISLVRLRNASLWFCHLQVGSEPILARGQSRFQWQPGDFRGLIF